MERAWSGILFCSGGVLFPRMILFEKGLGFSPPAPDRGLGETGERSYFPRSIILTEAHVT